MNVIAQIKKELLQIIKVRLGIQDNQFSNVELKLNVDKDKNFGDLSCNVALVLAKELNANPRDIAQQVVDFFNQTSDLFLKENISKIEIAGPGFLNIFLTKFAFTKIALELFALDKDYFKLSEDVKKNNYLIEFVSANPTGPLHLGHGRGGIIGDVLANVLDFLGHDVRREFYINDAGSQITKLGNSFKVRCLQELGKEVVLPEDGYKGEYLIELAKECVQEFGEELLNEDDLFFANYAKDFLLKKIEKDLLDYGIKFDNFFSEKSLHESGVVKKVIKELQQKDLVYEDEGALWFRSTKFGDDKDRVVQKKDGELTYIAADIAYHENKFERGYEKLIDILGQDHHGYVKRLKSTIQALGFNAENLDVILYQLVTIKNKDEAIRMSKRAGTFTTLREVIDTVGKDVARFFYLNRKAEAHLDFDLSVALKKTEENPVFYIQYAYVRTLGILEKAADESELIDFVIKTRENKIEEQDLIDVLRNWGESEFGIIKKFASLGDILQCIGTTYQTHLLSYYALELAHKFHNYYANNRIIDLQNIELSKSRLFLVVILRNILGINLDLLGISKPEKM